MRLLVGSTQHAADSQIVSSFQGLAFCLRGNGEKGNRYQVWVGRKRRHGVFSCAQCGAHANYEESDILSESDTLRTGFGSDPFVYNITHLDFRICLWASREANAQQR